MPRKGAKRRTGGSKLRSTGTKVGTRVVSSRESQAALIKDLKARARDLEKKLKAGAHDLTEARQQQTATSEVLKVISRSPNQLQPVLDSIAATAAELCHADFAMIHTLEHGRFRLVASFVRPERRRKWKRSLVRRASRLCSSNLK